MDTSVLKNTSLENSTKQRNKVIKDNLITPRLFDLLVTKVYASAEDIYHVTQQEIITILKPMHICNKTIARVVNVIIPNAKATQGSIASLIRFMENKTKKKLNTLVDMLTQELEKEFSNDV